MFQKLADTMNKISVKGKIKAAIGCLAGALAFVSIVGSLSIFSLKTNLVSYENVTEASKAISSCRIDINQISRILREMVIEVNAAKHEVHKKEIEAKKAEITERITVLDGHDYISQDVLESYKGGIQSYYSIADDIVQAIYMGQREEAFNIIQESCIPTLEVLIEQAALINDEIEMKMEKEAKYANMIYLISMVNNAVILLGGLAFAVFLTRKLFEDIFVPVEAIEHATKKMEEGHLNLELTFASQDEMGKMADSLRNAANTLKCYIQDISRAMGAFSQGFFDVQPEIEWTGDFYEIYTSVYNFEKNMSRIVTEIYTVAEQVDRSAAQVADSASLLAQGATDQAAIIEELAATIESVSAQVLKNADHARQISKSVEGVGEEIVNSNEKMREMVSSMQKINDSSKKISNIIATINDIASQTNLLALNASIEAARAGEAGRGFAVVADQVSVLAAQSADAAKESTYLIESSVNAVEKGMVIADETAQHLEAVVASSKTITQEVSNVANVLSKQAEAFVQINSGVEHISDVVQNNSAVSQECAAASEEMNAQATSLEQLLRSFRVLKTEN